MSLKDEIRRLEKAARDKNKNALMSWLLQYNDQVQAEHERNYAKVMEDERTVLFDTFVFLMAYSMLMSEETLVKDEKSINEFICDFVTTLELLGKENEYTIDDYKKQLEDIGISFTNFNKVDMYKTLFPNMDSDLVKYIIRKNHRKIALILAEPDIMKDEIELLKVLSEKSKTVIIDSYLDYGDFDKPSDAVLEAFNRIDKEKILLSDEVYILLKDDSISLRLKALEEYAKQHNKKIIYKKVAELYG